MMRLPARPAALHSPTLRGRQLRQHAVPPFVALVGAWSWLAARSGLGWQVFTPSAWGHWDSGQYLRIAKIGYVAQWHCTGKALPPHVPPGNYLCGNVAWFPGYPAAMRFASEITRLPLDWAGLLISLVCWYGYLWFVWRLLATARTQPTRLICLALAALGPGAVYLPAIFPISMALFGMVGCLYFAFRSQARWAPLAAFAFGAFGATGYISPITLAPAMLVALVATERRRWLPVIAGASGVVCGFVAVLITQYITVRIWNGYFLSQSRYASGSHNPLVTFFRRLKGLWNADSGPGQSPSLQRSIAWQGAYTALLLASACMILLTAAVVVLSSRRHRVIAPAPMRRTFGEVVRQLRAQITGLEVAALACGGAAWILAYGAGSRISSWRSEAFVAPVVLLLARVRRWYLLLPMLALAAVAAMLISVHFFDNSLV